VVVGIVLAGGRGTRFGSPEKCLAPVCGIPLLFRVAGALAQVIDEIYVATTPAHRQIADAATRWGLGVVYTPGRGYERDLPVLAAYAPAVIAACDIADLAPRHVYLLLEHDVFATALSSGEYVGLSYIPAQDLSRWVEAEVGELHDVDTPEDLERAEDLCPSAYPLYVDASLLKPHEQIAEARSYQWVAPIAVDYRSGAVLDGHHRLQFLRAAGLPAPVLLFDYDVVDVNVDKGEILRRAFAGRLFPPKTTWHTYRGRHISQIPTVAVTVDELKRRVSGGGPRGPWK
jgi:GTP:adenosylcobinamide-phosphate guanylyltransferase